MSPVFTAMENEVTNELKKLFQFDNCDSLFLWWIYLYYHSY